MCRASQPPCLAASSRSNFREAFFPSQSQPRWMDLITSTHDQTQTTSTNQSTWPKHICFLQWGKATYFSRLGQSSHLFLTFGAKPRISHVWGNATSFTRFLGFQFKPKEVVPLTRRLLPHGITLIRIVAIAH